MKPNEHRGSPRRRTQGLPNEPGGLFETLIDNLPDFIYVKDTDHRFLVCNLAVAKQFGLASPEEVIGKTDFDFHPHDQAEQYQADERVLFETGEAMVSHQEVVVLASGAERWYSSTKVPFRDENGRIVGLIGIGRDITRRKLAEDQVKQYAEELEQRNAAMHADLDLAREIQQAVLPAPGAAGQVCTGDGERMLQVEYSYLPSAALGGDFLDIYPVSDTAVGIFLCDAVGHGTRAALLTALVKGILEEMRAQAADAGALMTEMNRALRDVLKNQEGCVFLTAIYLVVDLDRLQLSYAIAGHPPPLRRTGNGRFAPLQPTHSGPALGLLPDTIYESDACDLEAEDTLLSYTDGLFEVWNDSGDELGHDALIDLLNDRAGEDEPPRLDQLVDDVRTTCDIEEFEDDVCAVMVRIRPANPQP